MDKKTNDNQGFADSAGRERRPYTPPRVDDFFESVLVVQATLGGIPCSAPKQPPPAPT